MFIAEVGGNHLGSIGKAFDLIHEAHYAGADAVKFQCFTPEQMADPGVIVKDGPWKGRELLDLYRETHTPREWIAGLFCYARSVGITPFASAFHPDDVAFLETLDCPMYKISSFEMTDTALIRHAAKTGKPLVISTGMASVIEIEAAVKAAYSSECGGDLTLLKCVSAYPAKPEDYNLITMTEYRGRFSYPWQLCRGGLSDHTRGSTCAMAATALGATMIEKHLILDRANGGPDAAFSAEPDEFAEMVRSCREVAAAIGEPTFGPTAAEASSLQFRRPSGGKRGS